MTAVNQSKVTSNKVDAAAAKNQLDLVLSFFPRMDAKLSVVLGLDIGMLGVLAAKVPTDVGSVPAFTWYVIAGFLVAILVSFVQLYLGSYPNVKGGEDSIIFFRCIAGKTEHKFLEAFKDLTQERLADELLGQAWRNAQILDKKITALKWAHIFTVVAVAPWAVALGRFAAGAH
ncbi:Pycsar system effector family protein [Dyella sp.]|uniref:Pycsar system effector family protein n=1 Tax=Dyella sp. TaxID=1869338 RepID=UPI00283CF6EF|nr:Pycsar system effector family protein [Dyella sp.]MDR3444472.1 DUF5706 domain-containing protein [Dyella sp.]